MRAGNNVVGCLLKGDTTFGSLMADFFELVHGIPFDAVPPESFLAVVQVHRFSFLGKQYCDGGSQWIRYCDSWSAGTGLDVAKVDAIYLINKVVYLCLSSYGIAVCEERGRLHLDGSRQSVPKVVSLDDMVCLNGMWCVDVDANGKRMFIEWL